MKRFMKSLVISTTVLLSGVTFANDWQPSGPVMLQIGSGAGGETDAIGRTVAKVIEEETGWDMVAENKPGGAGIAMLSAMKNLKADGRVIGMAVNMPVLVNLVLRGDKLPFKLDSFDYLGTAAGIQLAIVARADAPFDDVAGLVEYAKNNDGLAIATDAKPQQLIMKSISEKSGVNLKPIVTKGSAEILQLMLGGKAMVGFVPGKHIPYVESGKLKMIASANSKRHGYAPETKTLIEQGYELFVDPTFYFMAPKGLSAEAKAALESALDVAMKSDEVKAVVRNTLSTEANNIGGENTMKMLLESKEGVATLFK